MEQKNEEQFKTEIDNFINVKLPEFDTFLNTSIYNLNKEWLPWEKDGDFVLEYRDESTGFRSVKSEIVINKSVEEVWNFITNVNNKLKFDKTFEKGYDVIKINENFKIQYQLYKGLLMISPRDFALLIFKEFSKEYARLFVTSIKTDKVPEVSGVVRADSLFGGNIIERIDDGKCKLTLFSVVKLYNIRLILNLIKC
jgi:hypothetical protein